MAYKFTAGDFAPSGAVALSDDFLLSAVNVSGGAFQVAGALNISGAVTAAGISSGNVDGLGAFVGLNTSNQLVLGSVASTIDVSASTIDQEFALVFTEPASDGLAYDSGAGAFVWNPNDNVLSGTTLNLNLGGGELVSQGTLELSGAATLASTLAAQSASFTTVLATGATQFDGAMLVDSTLEVVSGVTFESTLDVEGNVTLGNAAADTVTATGQLSASEGAIVNKMFQWNGAMRYANAHTYIVDVVVPVTSSVLIGSGGAAITFTMPVSPEQGDAYIFKRHSQQNFDVTLTASGANYIDEETELVLDTAGAAVTLVYEEGSGTWNVF